jgi:23S rRNA (cytosine1962-C5)-methyltransferase
VKPPVLPPEQARAEITRQADMLANRVKKNFKTLYKRFEQRQIGAFRLYDRDIPEIRVVIDWYEGHLVVGEYARTQTDALPGWLDALASAVAVALAVAPERVHVKRRQTRPSGGAQRYAKLGQSERRFEVREGDLRFLVNLDDYLDTGLFPDHRETRQRVRAESSGKAMLNLFGYTGTFTCHAAAGGAASTTTVDASSRYLAWAKDNLELNRLGGTKQELVRDDVAAWLARMARGSRRWQVVVLDPPSFSDKGEGLDVQRDHRGLVEATLPLVAPGGLLYFSTNHQRFEPRLDGLAGVSECVEITEDTVPVDYRNRQVHRCWRIVK